MAVTGAKIGMGSRFFIGDGFDGGSSTYTPVGEVTNITPPGISREAIDVTHLESDDEFREFIPGLADGDPATISFNYIPDAADPLYAAIIAGKGDFVISYPGASSVKIRFSGVITGWKPGDASTTTMVGEMTIKPSGKPLLSAAAV